MRFSARCLHFGLLAALVVLFAAPSRLPAQKELRMKFKAGEKRSTVTKQAVKSDIFTPQQAIKTKTDMVIEVTTVIESVADNGDARQVATVDRMKMVTELPGEETMEYDSASEEKPTGLGAMIAEAIQPMIGAQVKQTLTSRGKTIDVELPEAMKEAGGLVGLGDGFAEAMKHASIEFPEGPVAVGDSWKGGLQEQDIKPLGKISITVTYTYLGTETIDGKEYDKIDLKGEVTFSAPEAGNQDSLPGMKIQTKDSEMTGTIYLDPEDGQLFRSTVNQKMTLELTIGDQTVTAKTNANVETESKVVTE